MLEITLRILPNRIANTTGQTIFSHKSLLTGRQVSKLRKAFAYNSCADMYLSKTRFFIIMQLGEFLGRLLGYLMKFVLLLMKM